MNGGTPDAEQPGRAPTPDAGRQASQASASSAPRAAKKTAAKKSASGRIPTDPQTRKAVAEAHAAVTQARKAAKRPPKPPPPDPNTVRLQKAIAAYHKDQKTKQAEARKAAKKAAAPVRQPAARRTPPPPPAARRPARTTVHKISKQVREVRRHPLRAAGHGLLYLLVLLARLLQTAGRRALRRARISTASVARRRRARLAAAPRRHVGCLLCGGTGTVTDYDAERRFDGSHPCPGGAGRRGPA